MVRRHLRSRIRAITNIAAFCRIKLVARSSPTSFNSILPAFIAPPLPREATPPASPPPASAESRAPKPQTPAPPENTRSHIAARRSAIASSPRSVSPQTKSKNSPPSPRAISTPRQARAPHTQFPKSRIPKSRQNPRDSPATFPPAATNPPNTAAIQSAA